jgi:hypothetical protein
VSEQAMGRKKDYILSMLCQYLYKKKIIKEIRMKYLLRTGNNTVQESQIKHTEKLPILDQEFPDESHIVTDMAYKEVDGESIPLITVHRKEIDDDYVVLGFLDDGTDEDNQSTVF